MTTKAKTTTDAVEILHRRYLKSPEARRLMDEARINGEIALRIHELRKKAKLTQTQLGRLIGTTASVISRLEDADYEGHSLTMLQRIASALNLRVEINFVPMRKKRAA